MSADKYPSIFSRQLEAIVYINLAGKTNENSCKAFSNDPVFNNLRYPTRHQRFFSHSIKNKLKAASVFLKMMAGLSTFFSVNASVTIQPSATVTWTTNNSVEETVSLTTSVELVDTTTISATATSGVLNTGMAHSPSSATSTQSSRAPVSRVFLCRSNVILQITS